MSLKIIIHPRSMQWLLEQCELVRSERCHDLLPLPPLASIPVIQSSEVPEFRSGPEYYLPPKPSRFVELGPEDHHWAPALGIGRMQRYVKIIDLPAINLNEVRLPPVKLPSFDELNRERWRNYFRWGGP